MAGLIGQVALEFNAAAVPDGTSRDVPRRISGMARVWDTLFVACSGASGIERLRLRNDRWSGHRHFEIGDFLDGLPGEHVDGIAIEALKIQDGWLWLTGTHAYERGRPRPGDSPERGLRQLSQRVFDPRRQFLGRLPLANLGDGLEPVKHDDGRRPEYLRFARRGMLRDWLEDDPFLGSYLKLPGGENGFDVGAVAVDGMRLWLGLRGPVLGGHALVLEMGMRVEKEGCLTARRLEGQRRYRLHLLPTWGGGIRDLVLDGEDMIMLVGAPGAPEGRSAVLRWRNALARRGSELVAREDVPMLVDLGCRGLQDNPEALVRWAPGRWLVVHDSPAPWRLRAGGQTLLADLMRLG